MKQLKNRVIAFMGALCISTCLTACGDSDKNNGSGSSKNNNAGERLVGE